MKKTLYTILLCFLSVSVFAQSSSMFNYQAILRNSSGEPMASQDVSLRIEVLKGSYDGQQVFTETHNITTNEFGLVSLEIGSVKSLDAVLWGDDIYFIQIVLDGNIMGTSQILGVPYALFAKEANETDPVFEASVAASIDNVDIANWNEAHTWGDHAEEGYLDEEADPTVPQHVKDIEEEDVDNWNDAFSWGDHAEQGYLTEENQNIADVLAIGNNAQNSQIKNLANPSSDQDAATKAYVDANAVKKYQVGDYAQGGVVFWVEECGTRGLVSHINDHTLRWHAGSDINTMALGEGIYAGMANTNIIIAAQGYGDGENYAARYCNELVVRMDDIEYGDWYLPSITELEIMYENKEVIDSVAAANGGDLFDTTSSFYYLSSTEHNQSLVKFIYMHFGMVSTIPKNWSFRFRAIRAF